MPEKRILLVDDDPQIVKLFTTILERGGYAVTSTTSGELAMQTAAKDRPDLLVLDLSMPKPDGFEILKQLRATAPEVCVLVISGFLQGSLLKAAKYVGAAETLSKTDAPESLLETVDRLLGAGQR
jgi:CheY-like chemotaxis protein